MIIAAFTPFQKGSQDYIELKKFLQFSSSKENKDVIKLSKGVLEINSIDTKGSKGGKQILDVINYDPRRIIIIDATQPNQVSQTLKVLISLIGYPAFNAEILSKRFFLITKDFFETTYELNQLLSNNDRTLSSLLEKPFHGQSVLY
ncbi:MAG: hypothetical protein HY094_02590 [Candidatus Melainabacteria bacterium]|nr:hypothetical protein [Candidatus Melainabacteria bacterium]